jgi:hypothetical protein
MVQRLLIERLAFPALQAIQAVMGPSFDENLEQDAHSPRSHVINAVHAQR